jgi:hypothetical protein
MKKFIVVFIILCILGGGAFFFGWAQLEVPPGAYGVIRSKTFGLDPRIVREGEFRWLWYKLIPTNVEIRVFRLERTNHEISVKNALPSGGTYAEFAGISADFSWEISGTLSFSINPDFLIQFISDNDINTQDDLEAAEKNISAEIEAFVLRRLGSPEAGVPEEIFGSGSCAELEKEILAEFPVIKGLSCSFKSVKFPDIALYRQIRGLYENFAANQREYVNAALARRAEEHIEARLRFDELEKYGELLAKYPILLQYLAIEKGVPKDGEQ